MALTVTTMSFDVAAPAVYAKSEYSVTSNRRWRSFLWNVIKTNGEAAPKGKQDRTCMWATKPVNTTIVIELHSKLPNS
jgi:hypothetical protein